MHLYMHVCTPVLQPLHQLSCVFGADQTEEMTWSGIYRSWKGNFWLWQRNNCGWTRARVPSRYLLSFFLPQLFLLLFHIF